MKNNLYIILIIMPIFGNGQESLRLFIGSNISNTKYFLENKLNNTDSMGWKDYYVLPYLGVDIDFFINDKFSFGTGLATSFMGARNYHTDIEDIPGLNLDSNLRILYLRLPLTIKYELSRAFKVYTGASINYSVRKNLNFFAADVGTFNSESIYNPFHIGALFGVSLEKSQIRLDLNYQQGITKIWDTQEYDESRRAFLSIHAFQVSIGYMFR